MKREIITLKRGVSGCCPGHDNYPNDSYGNRRSKKARRITKKKEHKYVRTLLSRSIKEEINSM